MSEDTIELRFRASADDAGLMTATCDDIPGLVVVGSEENLGETSFVRSPLLKWLAKPGEYDALLKRRGLPLDTPPDLAVSIAFTPKAYAEHITCSIGFVNKDPGGTEP